MLSRGFCRVQCKQRWRQSDTLIITELWALLSSYTSYLQVRDMYLCKLAHKIWETSFQSHLAACELIPSTKLGSIGRCVWLVGWVQGGRENTESINTKIIIICCSRLKQPVFLWISHQGMVQPPTPPPFTLLCHPVLQKGRRREQRKRIRPRVEQKQLRPLHNVRRAVICPICLKS